jgi:hypothetical protein
MSARVAAVFAALVCCVAGCSDKKRPASAYEDPKREQAEKIAAAKKAYSAFVDEAASGVTLLETRPWTNADDALRQMKDQNERLHQKLADAKSKGLSELKKFRDLQTRGESVMKYFGGAIDTADKQVKDCKDSPTESQVTLIAKGCQNNLGAIRTTLDLMKARIEGSVDDTKKADEKK